MSVRADHAATERTPQEILATGAAWITEAELARIVALAERASELERALREIALHDGGGEYGDRCQHRMAGDKHPNCRPIITQIARAALGETAPPEGQT